MQIRYAWSYKCSSAEPTHPHILSKTVQILFLPHFSLPALITTHMDISQRTSLSSSLFKTGTATESPIFCSPSLKSVVKTITDKAQYKPKSSENEVFYDISQVTIPCSQTMVSPLTILFLPPSDKHMDNQE